MAKKSWWRGNGQGGGLAIGVAMGTALSVSLGNWALLPLGVAVGVVMDAAGRKDTKPPER